MKKIIGLDIGYSNLKMAFGEEGVPPRTLLRPAGAAPADRFGTGIGDGAQGDFLHVQVDGEPFIAGVTADRAAMWARSLHSEYSASPSYKALFHAGLLMAEMEHVDVVVTGLPVAQYLDPTRRARVVTLMTGEHQITPKRSITVGAVKVIPQPVGGYFDYLSTEGSADLQGARVLVVDPGFFSVDWVVIANAELRHQSSGTSLEASSVVLEHASRLIGTDHGASVTTEKLENAVRAGQKTILVFGQKVEIEPYLTQALLTEKPIPCKLSLQFPRTLEPNRPRQGRNDSPANFCAHLDARALASFSSCCQRLQ